MRVAGCADHLQVIDWDLCSPLRTTESPMHDGKNLRRIKDLPILVLFTVACDTPWSRPQSSWTPNGSDGGKASGLNDAALDGPSGNGSSGNGRSGIRGGIIESRPGTC